MIENLGHLSEEKINLFVKEANTYFTRISSDISNGELLLNTVKGDASMFIVKRLGEIEQTDKNYWDDQELSKWFDDHVNSGDLIFPKDPIDKLRWKALVCIVASRKEGFSYGNVIFPPDYIPEDSEDFMYYERYYRWAVLERIIKLRENLRSS